MKFTLASLSATFAAVAVGTDTEKCTYALELVQVQDGSSSFVDHVELMRKTAKELVHSLTSEFGEFRYGVCSFVDKPIPLRGLGYYGNYGSLGSPVDWCYRLEAPLSADSTDIARGLAGLGQNMGSGGDFPENPYEGMLFAAYSKKVGWSPPSKSHAESGRPIARIMIMFTDDVPHLKGDAYAGTATAWNWPREYKDRDYSSGGFGSRSWGDTHYIYYRSDSDADKQDYVTMSNLFRSVDEGETLSSKNENKLNKLIQKFGPYPWPAMLDHPGDDSLGCDLTEYPSQDQLGKALMKHKITPIILLARPTLVSRDTAKRCASIGVPTENGENDIMDCLVKHYTEDLESMGVLGVVDTISASNVLDQMLQAISKATEEICIGTTTTSTTTEEETTTSAEETTSKAHRVTTAAKPTKATTNTETDTDSTRTETETSTASKRVTTTSTSLEEDTTASTTTEPEDRSESSAARKTTTRLTTEETTTSSSEKASSSVPVIAGATGGAVAAAAAAAGILYKKVGLSMFGGQGTPDLSAAQQVETPESPVERETMEEVTMDMFQ